MLEVVEDTLRALETACSGSRDKMQRDLVALCKGWLWACERLKPPDGVDQKDYCRINDNWKSILINIQSLAIMLKLPSNGFCNAATSTLFDSSEENDSLIRANIACWAGEKRCHNMTLQDPWFDLVKSGAKEYEGRRRSAKTSDIKPGDLLCFHHHTDRSEPPFFKMAAELIEFPTFEDALRTIGPEKVLPTEGMTLQKGVETYKRYVSIQTQLNDGVVMVRLLPY